MSFAHRVDSGFASVHRPAQAQLTQGFQMEGLSVLTMVTVLVMAVRGELHLQVILPPSSRVCPASIPVSRRRNRLRRGSIGIPQRSPKAESGLSLALMDHHGVGRVLVLVSHLWIGGVPRVDSLVGSWWSF